MEKLLVNRLKEEYPEILFLKTLRSKGHELCCVRIIFTVDRVMYRAESFYTTCGIGKDVRSALTFLQNYREGLTVADISTVTECRNYSEAEANFCTQTELCNYEDALRCEAFKALVNYNPEITSKMMAVHFTLIPELSYIVTICDTPISPSTDNLYKVIQVDMDGKIFTVKEFKKSSSLPSTSNLVF